MPKLPCGYFVESSVKEVRNLYTEQVRTYYALVFKMLSAAYPQPHSKRLSEIFMLEVLTPQNLWQACLNRLQDELTTQQFDTWIRPLQARLQEGFLYLLAPNQFVQEKVSQQFLEVIKRILDEISPQNRIEVVIQVGSSGLSPDAAGKQTLEGQQGESGGARLPSNLNPDFTFSTFVEGKSNQLAKAAAIQVSEHPGSGFNPLLLYGAVGLGKTHLMHAVGNIMLAHNPKYKVVYLHSERFVSEMIRALQANRINHFKDTYRAVDALFIDDIQFFAGKDRSQEELFHIFNALLESGRQMIFTCDRYPKEITGLEERLKSRFGWGLTVAIEPPELETRVAILLNKAERIQAKLSSEVAFFIAKRIRSNVRELEGALKRVVASAHFMGKMITIDLAKEALKDLIALQDKLVTIENIQKTVAEYYKIKVSDLLSKSRSRSVTRPRQVAMALAKELTNHSLPEIGDAFGGRDHTTVIHAYRLIEQLKESQMNIQEDWKNLIRTLSS